MEGWFLLGCWEFGGGAQDFILRRRKGIREATFCGSSFGAGKA